jgi:uncharacterized membrane protein YbhN (UPF0104 family)
MTGKERPRRAWWKLRGQPSVPGRLDQASEPSQPEARAPEPSAKPTAPALLTAVRSLWSRLAARLPKRAWRPPGGLRPWITFMSLGFVLAALINHSRQLRQYQIDPQGWLWLAMGVGCCLLSLVVSGLAWVVILRWLGLKPRPTPVVSLYIATNLRKFIPGGIWHLAGRVQALRQPSAALGAPVATPTALLAVLIEPPLAATAALALVSLGGWQNGLGAITLLPLLLLMPRWLNPLPRRLERGKAAQLGLAESEALPPSPESAQAASRSGQLATYPWAPLLAQLVFVLLRFAGFACCVWAFDLQATVPWTVWLSGFALAWTLGLVVPGAPGGLGVFEAALLLRLSVVLPEASVLAVALAYRLVVTGADLLAAGLVGLDGKMASLEFPSA